MSTALANYNGDVIAWANEQARLLRSGQFSQLDIEHIADEIEDVGKSEQRELQSRLIVLIAHLLKFGFQPERKSSSWIHTIKIQRVDIAYAIKKMPSLKTNFSDDEWFSIVWGKSKLLAMNEAGFDFEAFPESCPWFFEQIINPDFWPKA